MTCLWQCHECDEVLGVTSPVPAYDPLTSLRVIDEVNSPAILPEMGVQVLRALEPGLGACGTVSHIPLSNIEQGGIAISLEPIIPLSVVQNAVSGKAIADCLGLRAEDLSLGTVLNVQLLVNVISHRRSGKVPLIRSEHCIPLSI